MKHPPSPDGPRSERAASALPSAPPLPISEILRGRNVFILGSTGFVGKVLLEEGGLIAGVMESIVKKPVTATEVTCIGGLGHKTCGFDVQIGEPSKLRAV